MPAGEPLLAVLAEGRRLGFLGPGPVESHVVLARSLLPACRRPPSLAIDLGSGGGIPGLVLAAAWPTSRWLLLDSSARRTDFLRAAVRRLGCGPRVEVLRARAEEAARLPAWRARADLVVARSFGSPPVTAECGAPFLRLGGLLVVAEPPGAPPGRWPEAGIALLGLRLADRFEGEGAWISLEQAEPCPDAYPRRIGLPGKRPLFHVLPTTD